MKIKIDKTGTTIIRDGKSFFDPIRKLEINTDGKTVWFNAPCSTTYEDFTNGRTWEEACNKAMLEFNYDEKKI